jgi:hypothetical protein
MGMRRALARSIMMLGLALGASGARAAGTGYGVDTAEVGDIGNCKVESWTSWASNRDVLAIANPSCVVGLDHGIEVGTQIQRARQDGVWGTSVAPKVKTNLIPSAIGNFGVAIAAGGSYDPIANAVTSYYAYAPATLRLSNVARLNLNAGWSFDAIANRHYVTYGAGVDLRTPDNVWTLTAEVFGQIGEADMRSQVQPRVQMGLRWRPIDRFSMDLIVGRNITGENANWITLATSIRFPREGNKAGE